jgi:hypothetical protein
MRNIYDCVESYIPLLNTEYEIILGRKGIAVTINLAFDKKDCYHLMGLQYLIDRPELNRDRGKIFDQIQKHIITIEQVETSTFYDRIKDRINFMPLLELIIDDNETVFKYNQSESAFSMIRADYLMKNNIEEHTLFLFLSKGKNNKYFCRSFFPKDKYDYTKNQASWTLLHKKKINTLDGTEQILYNRLTVPDSISTRTLEDMDRAISNFKMGEVSPTVDLSDF